MIKFFRHIRQSLIMENKTGKYFKYAIGEIVLVVIGILIALQVNNLNEQRKIDKTTQDYYCQLLEDLKKDKAYIKETIAFLDSTINTYDTYIKTYNESNLNFNQAQENIYKLGYKNKIIAFNTNTIETLNNTGDLKLISLEIRNKLIDLKQHQNRTIKALDENSNIAGDILKVVSMETGGSLPTRLSNQPELTKTLIPEINFNELFLMFEAFQDWKVINERQTLNSLKEILSSEDDLINLINEEIQK